MNILEVNNVDKYFLEPSRFHVLKDITFAIKKGKLVTITGKSGSGKSTLLYLLSTMDTEFSGSIRVDGEELKGKSNRWLSNFRNEHIGFVFQFHYLLPEFTSLHNVMLPALKRGTHDKESIEEKAYGLLKMLDIEDQAVKRSSLLSGGQQQRVAIARSLINDPLLIMCDEPTGNLDSKNTQIAFGIFREIIDKGEQTMIMVTHDEDLADRSDEIIHLEDGRVV
ncbi:ABC transporter ATP-binding protein [Pleomorphovibrio marinus]|uniref:ABC transporter ATP-binding protein n=1 Tax=Pleomorphovibrio marinus TaxID=2164132 RepID=UPI000E0AFB10|nr:ABC transporter ATP-binding protein [Pleomorphovibrio marinus]